MLHIAHHCHSYHCAAVAVRVVENGQKCSSSSDRAAVIREPNAHDISDEKISVVARTILYFSMMANTMFVMVLVPYWKVILVVIKTEILDNSIIINIYIMQLLHNNHRLMFAGV